MCSRPNRLRPRGLSSPALRRNLGLVLVAIVLGGCDEATAPAPRHISSDALAFMLELAEERVSTPIGSGLFSETVEVWEVDGREVPSDALDEIDVGTVQQVTLDTLGGAVRLYSDRRASVDSHLAVLEVFSSGDVARGEGGERRRTLFWLSDVVLSGDDVAALGSRRSDVERRLDDVVVFRPSAVSRAIGSEIDITVTVASTTLDVRSLLLP